MYYRTVQRFNYGEGVVATGTRRDVIGGGDCLVNVSQGNWSRLRDAIFPFERCWYRSRTKFYPEHSFTKKFQDGNLIGRPNQGTKIHIGRL